MTKKYSNIDDLFRDKFKDFELFPPDHIWENIKHQISQSNSGKQGNNFTKGGIIGITIILILTSIFTLYLLQNSEENGYVKETEYSNPSPNKPNKSVPRSVEIPSSQIQESEVVSDKSESRKVKSLGKTKQIPHFDLATEGPSQHEKSNLIVGQTQPKNSVSINDQNMVDDHKPVYVSEKNPLREFNSLPGHDSELLDLNAEESVINSSGEPSEESSEILEDGTLESEMYIPEPNSEIRSDYGKKGNWLFGLFFTPEMVFFPSASDYNNRNYSVDANVIYRFSGYTLQSGLGVGWSTDNGNYKIDYNKYLGSYDDVYYVTFDTTGGQVTPIYHTETVKVYDSINHLSITPTKRHFTYLNVPVLFGYGNEGRRFGWFVKAGPSISFLIHENIPDINLTDSQDKILNMDSEIPGRLKTNWQFVFAGGASYKMSNSLSVTIEPVFRYYIKSTHEAGTIGTKTPYSLGLRVGLMLGF